MSSFESSVALVTGAANGIGYDIAAGLAARGASVALLDIDAHAVQMAAEAIDPSGERAIGLRADVSDESSVASAVAAVTERFGRLDIAVNNAGVPSSGVDLMQMTAEQWQRVLSINLTGVFFSMKHELPALRASRGAIVNVASGGGLFAIPRSPAYVASKHGVVGLTKAAARDYAAEGIRVNAIAPGMTRTSKLEQVAESSPMIDDHIALTPLGRLATTVEVADAAIWLASDESAYITGVVLQVDGGRRL